MKSVTPTVTNTERAGFRSHLGHLIWADRYALKSVEPVCAQHVGRQVIVQQEKGVAWGWIERVEEQGGRQHVLVYLPDRGTAVQVQMDQVDVMQETQVAETWLRVARAAAEVEKDQRTWTDQFFWALSDHRFVPGGRVLAGLGRPDTRCTANNCYVLGPIVDSRRGIHERLEQMGTTMAYGGGVGICGSSLRPRGCRVRSVQGRSSGAVAWFGGFSWETGMISQGGSRRGALMIKMDVWHPDIPEFIRAKQTPGVLENANISVGLTDEFLEAVETDADWTFVFPDTTHTQYDELWRGDLVDWRQRGLPVVTYSTVRARSLWDSICASAWACAEPGLLFVDRAKNASNSYYYPEGRLVGTNPCGEQWLPGFGACLASETLISCEGGIRRIGDFHDGRVSSYANWSVASQAQVIPNGVRSVVNVTLDGGMVMRLTGDHRLIQDDGQEVVALESLGSRVRWMMENPMLCPIDHGSEPSDIALLLGWMHGDGWMTSSSIGLSFNANDGDFEIKERILAIYHHFFGSRKPLRDTDVSYQEQTETQSAYDVISTCGVYLGVAREKRFPEIFWGWPLQDQLGFLRMLFTADGWVGGKGMSAVQFSTSSAVMARELQQILGALGFQSRLHRTVFADSNRQDQLRITISKTSARRFMKAVGFATSKKQGSFNWEAKAFHDDDFLEVIAVENFQEETEVFDLSVPGPHVFFANGVLVHNCNLGHINLSAFVQSGEVQWSELAKTVQIAVRFMDNVVDVSDYPMEEMRAQQQLERRVGLGTLGLAEMLIEMGLVYGSPAAVEFVDKVYSYIAEAAYCCSANLAEEKGTFPAYDRDILGSGFMRTMPVEIRTAVHQQGLRNVTLLTSAPTGTIGTMVGTSTGIEPFYALESEREGRFGRHTERVQPWQVLVDQGVTVPPVRMVTSMQVSPEGHIAMMAAIQRWMDSSISKTVNLPQSATIEDVGHCYLEMWKRGCKGGTVYRDKSREKQVLHLVDAAKIEGKAEILEQLHKAAIDSPLEIGQILGSNGRNGKSKPALRPLPDRRPGVTMTKASAAGNCHITVNHLEGDPQHPLEAFLEVGKGGSDLKAMAEALGRLASLVLRLEGSVGQRQRVQEMVQQLQGIGGRQTGFGPARVRSVPDAFGQVLAELYCPELRSVGLEMQEQAGDVCPSCSNTTVQQGSGCEHCSLCGWSAC